MSILLAAGAFVVSLASLWFSSLRRPNVGVDRIAGPHELGVTGWSGGMASGTRIDLHFYVANSGASGTVVERLDVIDLREVNEVQTIWSGLGPGSGFKGVAFPLAMERDDATTGRVLRDLEWSNESPQIATDEEFARRVGGLRSISLTFEWTFRRPHLFRPWRHESVKRRVVVTIDAVAYRQQNVYHWRSTGGGDYARLADIAESASANP